MRIHQVQPKKKWFITKRMDPIACACHENISRGEAAEFVHGSGMRACHPLAILEIEFVVYRAQGAELLARFGHLAIQLPLPNHRDLRLLRVLADVGKEIFKYIKALVITK